MAKTFRNIALAGIIATCAAGGFAEVPPQGENLSGIYLTGMRLHVTEGEQTLQEVKAAEATFRENAGVGEIRELDVLVRQDGNAVRAVAPLGQIRIGGPERTLPPEGPVDLPLLKRYARDFPVVAASGDLMLFAEDGALVQAEVGEQAIITAPTILWSAQLEKILVPSDLTQRATGPDGTRSVLEASGAVVGKDLENWEYFAAEKRGTMTLSATGAQPEEEG